MSSERLTDGPDRAEMIQLIRDAFPDAVVATIGSAASFSLDETLMPLITAGHDRLAARQGARKPA